MPLIITLILMALSAIATVVFVKKPATLTEAERNRLELQAAMKARQVRLEEERRKAALTTDVEDEEFEASVTVRFQVIGTGRRKNAVGFEVLGKGWVGPNNKDRSMLCYFPVFYRDGKRVDTHKDDVVVWMKTFDEVSHEIHGLLETATLPVQVELSGDLYRIKDGEQPVDGTVHVNRRLDVTGPIVLIPKDDARWVRLRSSRGQKMSKAEIDAYMPLEEVGKEVTSFETIAELKARMFGTPRAEVMTTQGASDVIPAPDEKPEEEPSTPAFGCTPELD